MSDAPSVFKISRAGKVIHEDLSLAQVVEAIALKAILPSDHYWSSGMATWDLVSSRQWAPVVAPAPAPVAKPAPVVAPAPAPTPAPAPAPVVRPNPVASSPAVSVTPRPANPAPAATTPPPASPNRATPPSQTPPPRQPAAPSLAEPTEKGYSPYVTYYRSNEDRWAFGVFGGLAHRNGWPRPLLLLIRILTLITVFPALAYLCGWGLTAMLLTPSLPTSKVKSYYDLNNGQPSQDATDMSRLIKIIVVGIVLLFLTIWFVSRRY